jgi:Proteins of 100 residues with WXG.
VTTQKIGALEGALLKGADAVGEAKSGIDGRIAFVRGELEQARQFWTGPAGSAFDGLMRRWDEQTTKLNRVLIDLEDALRGTDKDKAALEDSSVSTITGLGSMMN